LRLVLARNAAARLLHPVLWGILLPPLVFFGWMLGGAATIGNDYPLFHVRSALSLRFYDSLGLEPMWYPHLGGGIPIGGLILAQYFHLPAWLQSHLPGFWEGHALTWITARHLLLFALLHGAFYAACRRLLGAGRTASYVLSFAFVYNARTLDAFRYGPGLDVTVYGQCAVLLAIAYILRAGRWRLALLTLATQLLLTGGYPVLIPLLLVAAGLTFALLLLSGRVDPKGAFRRGAQVAIAASVGALLAAPAVAAIVDFLLVNQARVAQPTLEWASAWSLTGVGLLQSAVAPWTADVNSAYGGNTLIPLLLATLAFWAAADLRRRWAVLVVLAFPFAYALGVPSPIYRFFFRFVPGFASLRVPARMLMVLPLLVFAVLLWMRGRTPGVDMLADGEVRRAARLAALLNLAAATGILVLVVTGPRLDALAADLSPLRLTKFWSTPWEALWLLLGIGASAAFAFVPRRSAGLVLVAATIVQTGLVMAHGTWVTAPPPGATREGFARANQLPLYGEAPFWASNELNEHAEASATVAYSQFVKAAGSQANCYLPIDPDRRKRGVLLPLYLSTNLIAAATREEALTQLRSEGGCRYDGSTRTVVTAPSAPSMPEATPRELAALNARTRLLVLQPNRVRVAVELSREAVLVTPYPAATDHWSGAIDGRPVELILVNGGFLGLPIPAGAHFVDIRYFSRRMHLGWRVFLATMVALAAAGTLAVPRSRPRRFLAAALVAALALVGAWRLDLWYVGRATADVLLPNDYPALLRRQLDRWQR
jgi:hypothetical protein